MQLQVEQWHEIVPQTKSGVEGYLASGLIKGIGPALAKQIVSRFGVETLDILQIARSGCWRSKASRRTSWRPSRPHMQRAGCCKT